MTQMFNITDADIQASLQLIDSHASTMRSTITQVENLGSDIGSAYRSQASTAFQTQLTNWGQIYQELLQSVQTLRDNLTQANQGITTTAENSQSQAQGLSGTISGILAG